MMIDIFSMGSYICLDTYVRPSVATNSHVEYTKDFGGASYLDPVLGHIFVLRMRAPLLRETLMYNREG